jgi:NTE family protein
MRNVHITTTAAIGVFALAVLGGCASRPVNPPIAQVDPTTGYRPMLALTKEAGNDPGTLFIVAFSGGGTRAAAFAYGVLEELRRTPITLGGHAYPLLHEVDMLTGVSGGSFTALAYALYGDSFFDFYADGFLKRDVQGELLQRLFNPFIGLMAFGGSFGRSELAADYYDEILFHGATFGDLVNKPTPFAMVTATDLSNGARLAFNQLNFDLLCSDLNTLRLSRAAAASSAVPVVLSPVTLNNYGGHCGFRYPDWVEEVVGANAANAPGDALQRFRDMQAFQDSAARPYIHLVDGGVSDNLGMRSVIDILEEMEVSKRFRGATGLGNIHRIAVVVVNAASSPSNNWDKSAVPPDAFEQLLQASSVPIDRYSYDTVELMKSLVSRWAMARELDVARAELAGQPREAAEAANPPVAMYVIDVSFSALTDPVQRGYFENLPTSFVLTSEQVDRLRAVAGEIMRGSAQYQALLKALGGIAPAPAAAAAPPPG